MSDSTVVVIDDASVMPELLGSGDAIIREIEAAFPGLDIHVRGGTISLTGGDVQVAGAAAVIGELRALIEAGIPLTPDVARRTARTLSEGPMVGAERPVAVLARSILSHRGTTIRPKTAGQAAYVAAIDTHTITFGIGPAGTGKTYLAMAQAVAALQQKRVTRIVLTRPAVEAGERLGFLPGTLSEKIDPYLRPLYDALHDMVAAESIPRLIESGTIEVAPLAYMRGRTLNDAFVILDEAQNTTREQMKMFLTRLGFGSTMVVTGDVTQTDIPEGMDSGLVVAREILEGIDDIAVCMLGAEDVVRHELVGRIVTAYARDDARRATAASRAAPPRAARPLTTPKKGKP